MTSLSEVSNYAFVVATSRWGFTVETAPRGLDTSGRQGNAMLLLAEQFIGDVFSVGHAERLAPERITARSTLLE